MSRMSVLSKPVKMTFDYGDLEATAKKVYALFVEHSDAETLRFNDGYNRARVIREAVESVAGY